MNLFENLQLMKEANNKELLFSFIWEKGSLNDNIINYLKSKNIRFRYGPYLQLFAQINGEWVRFYHENKDGKTNVYIISSESVNESTYGMEKYSYTGPIYRFNHVIGVVKNPIFTVAKSYDEAMKNICFKLKKERGFTPGTNLTIDKDKIKRDTEIEKLTKEFEKEPEQIETKVDDPKFNFDDPDREEEYVVESILSFDDWLDKNFTNLVKDYADKYEMEESEVYDEDEDFEEYVNDRYEEYYRNTNRYIDDENEEELLESVNDNKYKITFTFNINEATSEVGDADEISVNYINDECFKEAFNTIEKIKEFEKHYNADDNDISIKEIKYDSDNEKIGTIEVILDSELQDEQWFADCIVEYLFEGGWPKLSYHASGTHYSDAWDGHNHYDKSEYIEDDYIGTISSYSDVTIKKIS